MTEQQLQFSPNLKSGSLKRVGLSLDFHARSQMKPDHDYKSAGDRVAADLRQSLKGKKS